MVSLNGLNALKSNFTRKLKQGITKSEFERAFSHIFGEDVDTFIRTFSQNMDTLEQQLTKETILESNCQNAFRVLKTQFEKIFSSMLIKPSSLDDMLDDKKLQIQECTVQEVKASDAISEDKAQESCMVSFRLLHSHLKLLSNNDLKGTRTESGFKHAFATLFGQDLNFTGTITETQFQMFIKSQIYLDDEYVVMTRNYFLQYTQLAIPKFCDTLMQHLESVKKSIDERPRSQRRSMTIGGTKSKEHDTSSRSGNDAHADDADIRPIYDEEPMAEVQTTAEINVLATGQQHTEQPEFNNEGEVDQNAEQCHDNIITFLENKPNVAGKGPTWLFDLDYLTDSLNYKPVRSENQANKHVGPQEANQNAGTKDIIDAGDSEKEDEYAQDYFVLPIWSFYSSTVKRSTTKDAGDAPNKHPNLQTNGKLVDKEDQVVLDELERLKRQEKDANDAAEALRKEFAQQTEDLLLQVGVAKPSSTNIVNTASTPVSTASPDSDLINPDQDDSEIPPLEDIYQNPTDGIFTNSSYDDEGAVADFTNLETVVNVSPIPTSRMNSIHPSTLILGDPKSAVQTRSKVTKSSRAHAFVSYVQKQRRNNHKDFQYCLFACFLSQNEPKKISEALKDKSLVDAMQEELLQFKIQKVWILGHRQEEGIDYDEVFAHVARIEAIRIFLAFASYMGFIVYQMDVKSAFLYGKIDEEVYVSQPPGFIDSKYPKKVYKVVKALYGLHQSPRACQDKYVAEILKNFDFVSVKTTSTPIETQKPLVKDEESIDVHVYLYRSMIGSLMCLTASRPDIMFKVCACARLSLFDLEAYSDSNYSGENLYRKSTTGGCQFLGRRLISWQCKKQTVVATSTTEAKYVAAANCCGQVLWIQNRMLDYGFNFMNTKIYIDNESTICIVKNPVYHSKTKHIAIRHHFIRDANEKKLIQVLKIHTDDNVADLLTKAFNVSRFQFLVVTIGMINP
ncbi:ribonuclease H-like domain-containing protein [Tanacetum coccineum]|uniref:Ribonuclease H-like domain-containing protein n=1 Tax=Tanacetum coccineum TaxID=301880 RepID=A0ABQ4YU72_9ASTR